MESSEEDEVEPWALKGKMDMKIKTKDLVSSLSSRRGKTGDPASLSLIRLSLLYSPASSPNIGCLAACFYSIAPIFAPFSRSYPCFVFFKNLLFSYQTGEYVLYNENPEKIIYIG